MKKIVLLTVLLGAMPLSMMAQDDDLYFTPKKQAATQNSGQANVAERPTYYIGSNRDVDEYNRRGKFWSHYQKIGTDSTGNDIIQFQKGRGVYPDSTYIDTTFVGKYYDTMIDGDDYAYSRRMSRWDGFYDPWLYDYAWGYGPYWRYSWYDPWYYGYAGWYDPWYDPWYYGYAGWGWGWPYYRYYGWGGPYYWGYAGWGYPYYWGGGYYARHDWNPRYYNGGRGFDRDTRHFGQAASGSFGSRDNSYTWRSGSNRSFGGRSDVQQRTYDNGFGRSQRTTRTYSPAMQGGTRSFGGGFSGGGFGGSRPSGSFGGGGRIGGGGGARFGGGHR